MSTLLTDVDVDGERQDVRVADGRVQAVGRLDPLSSDEVVAGNGGALLPGLHDHHLHLLALAAAEASVDVSGGLDQLSGLPGSGWVRAVGWTGEGDRYELDRVLPGRPLRVQHRSGALWVLNSAAVRLLRLDTEHLQGIERGPDGTPTGRVWRLDRWLGERVGHQVPDLPALGRRLASRGNTGVTDATPDLGVQTCTLLRAHVPQRLLLLGDPLGQGPVKVVLADHELPTLDDLVQRIAHARPRPVAVHCVTRVALVLLLAAWDVVGRHPGDRVEHAGVVPPVLAADLPLCVTQPAMACERGDEYLRDVAAEDRAHLYPYGDLLARGVPVVPSSDAPYGPVDPWQVLRAARDRRTPSGEQLAGGTVPVATALDGMLRPLEDPRQPARSVREGAAADLVLLSAPLRDALAEPSAELVRATWVGGAQVFG
jgi:predicted amidohydrolase YtcJ